MENTSESEARYKNFINNALEAYMNKQYSKAIQIFTEASMLVTKLKICKTTITLHHYIFCYCLVESKNLDNLAKAIQILENMDEEIKNKLLAIYFLLAKAHYLFFRFNEALEAIDKGEKLYRQKDTETFYIPNTRIPIEPNKIDEVWSKLKEECSAWHSPDAVCALQECNNVNKPYVTPNKLIFYGDPSFHGMVVVKCNNKIKQCSLKYHQCCWKLKKGQMSELVKSTDKDMLGYQCLTPNCLNHDAPSVISLIEIIGQNGEIKSQTKESDTSRQKVSAKGAVKKVKLSTPKKSQSPVRQSFEPNAGILINKSRSREKFNCNRNYDNNQILVVEEMFDHIDFSYESEEEKGEKSFLFSFFYDYIQNTLVTVADVFEKFSEINGDMKLKHIDILAFLLETNKIGLLDTKDTSLLQIDECISKEKKKNLHKNLSFDIADVYDDLMNDNTFDDINENEENQVPKKITDRQAIKTCIVNQDFHTNSIYNQDIRSAGGDAPLVESSNSKNSKFSTLYGDADKRGSENRKLKEFIVQLEYQLKEIEGKNSELKEELINKELLIESFKKEQENYCNEIEKYKALYEVIKDFQKRFEKIQDENLLLKEEMINLVKEKENLEQKLLNNTNPETRRSVLMNTFKEEYQILHDSITSDWEKKIKKLEILLETENEAKMQFMNKCINYLYSCNKNILIGHIQHCESVLDLIVKINQWLESTMSFKYFIDHSQWMNRMVLLQKIVINMKEEYLQSIKELHSSNTDKLKLSDVIFSNYQIPPYPQETIADMVIKSLHIFYTNQCHIMQSILKPPIAARSIHYQLPTMVMPNHSQNTLYAASYPYSSNIPVNFMQSTAVSQFSGQKTELEHLQEKPSNVSSLERIEHAEEIVGIRTMERNETDIENNLNNFQSKIKKMRKALKTLSVEEDKKSSNSIGVEGIQDQNITENSFKKNEIMNEIELKSIISTDSIKSMSSKIENTFRRKIGFDGLLKIMQQEYPSALEAELIDIIEEIRHKHKDCLSGVTVRQIFKESEEHFQQNQHLHLLKYGLNHGNNITIETAMKSSGFEQQSCDKEIIFSAPCSFKKQEIKCKSSQKKTWNILPKEKWISKNKEECSICTIEDPTKIWYTLSCQHSFHKNCVKPWLKDNRSCPNCRMLITEDDDFPPLPA